MMCQTHFKIPLEGQGKPIDCQKPWRLWT